MEFKYDPNLRFASDGYNSKIIKLLSRVKRLRASPGVGFTMLVGLWRQGKHQLNRSTS